MKRTLGRSGIEVSALGMGCWAIGGPFWAGGTFGKEGSLISSLCWNGGSRDCVKTTRSAGSESVDEDGRLPARSTVGGERSSPDQMDPNSSP